MHGQAKLKSSEEEKERKRKEREQKVQQYKNGMAKIFAKRKNKEHDNEALALIADLLCSNPDIYTLWNFRKEILQTYKKEKSVEDLAKILVNEMRLTEMCLKCNPKSYCAWYHRLWLITNWPNPDLKEELNLCNKYLKLDERNFHCWNYRGAVASLLGLQPKEELQYTLTKIEENFSNYSSWHYRSKLLPLIYPDPAGIRPVDEKNHLYELELVENAAFTDPNDQSAWFYLRWLLGRLQPALKAVVVTARNGGKLCTAFNQNVTICNIDDTPKKGSINVIVNGLPKSKWISVYHRKDTGTHSSKIWFTEIPDKVDENLKISFTYTNGSKEDVSLDMKTNYTWSSEPVFDSPFSPNLTNVLKQQLNSCNQLLDLEPDSKWTLLTSAVLMLAIDKFAYKDTILKRLELLKKCDKLRANYYDDLRSKYLIECILQKWDFSDKISLANLDLTAVYHSQYLIGAVTVDLSNNRLSRSLHDLYALTKCQILHLDKNNLTNLKGLPRLPSLKSLTLHGNKLSSVEDIVPYLSKHKSLERLIVSNNPIATHGFGDLAIALPGVSIICDSH
ncbi:hypothetical protein O3M35_005110 [Rhynocoris fuscipes]|uniref:Geranylgeranyl transferase type-2 subunit alpha n=1 Tax=Rhynocoris fuscipes TaxID=488301 RepID=A0AAW1DJ95_9HEMI